MPVQEQGSAEESHPVGIPIAPPIALTASDSEGDTFPEQGDSAIALNKSSMERT